jgi:hypothetical protein
MDKLPFRILILTGVGLVAVIVMVIAIRQAPSHPPATPTARSVAGGTTAAASLSRPSPSDTETGSTEKTNGSAVTTIPGGASAPAEDRADTPLPPQPSEELLEVVHKFSISEVKPGQYGRALIDGKMHYVGENVGHGLQLFEIKDRRLIFIDGRGARYPRPY